MSTRSSHKVGRSRRSPREWAGRIALACGVAWLGYQSIVFSLAQVLVVSQPDVADAIAPYDGRLDAAHAAELIASDASTVGRRQAETLARIALRRDPTAVPAAATLGVVTLARNNTATARRLLAYAQMLSRRNVQTQLWSIEDAVGHGNIVGALRWYDIALRTKPEIGDVLYPVLAQASRDPAIRAALVNTLAEKPPWLDSYVSFAAGQKNDAQNTATLFAALHMRGVSIPAAAQAATVDMLLDGESADAAWRYYATIRSGAERSRARDPRFATMLDTPSAFDWTALNDNGVVASIQRASHGGAFEFSAPPSIGGPVLQQVQLLPVGSYHLAGHSDGIAQDESALPYWTLICRNDGRELGRVVVSNSAQAGGRFDGMLRVPVNCPVQVLVLYARPSDAIDGVSGQIDRISLAPVGQQLN